MESTELDAQPASALQEVSVDGVPSFVHDGRLPRVVFGAGTLTSLGEEVDRLEGRRAMVIASEADRALQDAACEQLGARTALRWNDVHRHVPAELAARAVEAAQRERADLLVTIGGGSTTGLGKVVALRTGIRLVAVPTTYAGSEMTPIWGLTEAGRKRTGRDLRVLPRTVIYDPELTLGLPAALSAASGMNAMAHCVEAFYSPGRTPIVEGFARMAIEALIGGLPAVVSHPRSLPARGKVLYGACLAGLVLGGAGVSVHHHVCHVLGGMFDLPHAELHAVLLPHTVSAVRRSDAGALSAVAAALGGADAPRALFDLSAGLGVPTALEALGMRRADLDAAVAPCVEATAGDIAPLDRALARELLEAAFVGRRPD